MVLNQLFLIKPDIEIILQLIRAFGFKDLTDRETEFNILTITTLNTVNIINTLEPILATFYLPCKKEKYIGDWTAKRCITVLRQFLKIYDLRLIYREKLINGKKYNVYKLDSIHNTTLQTTQTGKYYINFD
jgi:hypothetical protein